MKTRRKKKGARRARRSLKQKQIRPRNLEEYSRMSEWDQELWDDVGQIVTEVKNGSSLRQASRKFNRDPRLVQRVARSGLRKLRNGRWAAKTRDKLLRVLPIPTSEGLIEVGIIDSPQASLLGKYWNAVERYLATGDASDLNAFANESVLDASGNRWPLLTDTSEL